ncbi:uncharacterized protein LOC111699944 [Eurytemora carolleeae]|uniref:uncharacterized protein LOC111699944 n=1 Tax=Eurytemora carolleeae TaxID=1294199 RepID=UPI000C76EABA|nr:uncharacterized protein LOC111699944 [Eurytemora carolleeae]|eukprot:XP_023326507.1 uncharacterized protein LOC111699944 [Eurytemora affinis]
MPGGTIIRYLFFTLCLGIALIQIWSLFQEYRSGKSFITERYDSLSSDELNPFPAITICSDTLPDNNTDVDVETILKYVGTPFKLKSEIKNMEGYSSKELRDHFYITYTLFNGICLTKKASVEQRDPNDADVFCLPKNQSISIVFSGPHQIDDFALGRLLATGGEIQKFNQDKITFHLYFYI